MENNTAISRKRRVTVIVISAIALMIAAALGAVLFFFSPFSSGKDADNSSPEMVTGEITDVQGDGRRMWRYRL